MTTHAREDERTVFEIPEGMLDYQARCAIRDLMRRLYLDATNPKEPT